MSLSDCLPSNQYADSGSGAVTCQECPNGTFANQSELTPSVKKFWVRMVCGTTPQKCIHVVHCFSI